MIRLKQPKPFTQLKKQLRKLKYAPDTLFDVLVAWINRCDGFLYDTYILDHPDHSIVYVTEKTIRLLSQLDKNSSIEEIIDNLARQFEGLYFYSCGRDNNSHFTVWNSTRESYKEFLSKLKHGSSENYYLDHPYFTEHDVSAWLIATVSTDTPLLAQTQ